MQARQVKNQGRIFDGKKSTSKIISHKTKMTYRGLDFDGDKPRMYKELRESMAEVYQDVDVKIFGPVNVTDFNENTKSNVD